MLIQLTLRSSLVFSFRKSDPIDQTERQLTAPPNPGPKKKKKERNQGSSGSQGQSYFIHVNNNPCRHFSLGKEAVENPPPLRHKSWM
jgi:hypothetical protein